MKLNYVHPPMVLSKIFDRSIYIIATWNSQRKIKLTMPCEQYHQPWLVKNDKTVFGKLTQQISLSVSGEQVSRQANTWPLAFLSQIFRYFLAFYVVILVEYPVLLFFGKCLMDSLQVLSIFTEFGLTIFMYHSKTFRRQVSFCSS